MVRKAYINPPPSDTVLPPGAPSDVVHADFAARLQRALINKGWNQSELARRAQDHLPEGNRLGRDNISGYIRGKTLPRAAVVEALAKALGVTPEDLLPRRGVPSAGGSNPIGVDTRDMGDGNVWLRVNQAVSWPVAIKVMALIKGEGSETTPSAATPTTRRKQQLSGDEAEQASTH